MCQSRRLLFAVSLSVSLILPSGALGAWSLQPIHVKDENGEPVANAEVAITGMESPITFREKTTDEQGSVVFGQADYFNPTWKEFPQAKLKVMARARGKVIAVAPWDNALSASLTLVMKPGKEVQLRLKRDGSGEIPSDLVPVISPHHFVPGAYPAIEDALEGKSAHSTWLENVGPGIFSFALDESSTTPLSVILDSPGVVQGFHDVLETTEVLKNGFVDVAIPETSTVTVTVRVPDEFKSSAGKPLMVELSQYKLLDDRYISINGGMQLVELQSPITTVTLVDLAPAEYSCQVLQRSPAQIFDHDSDELYFKAYKSASLKPGETVNVEVTYKEFDPASLKGEATATVHIKQLDGSPAAGMAIQMRQYQRDFGDYYVITSGTLDERGTTVIENLAAQSGNAMGYEIALAKKYGEKYGERIGRFTIKEGETSVTRTFTVPPVEGDVAPDITLTDVHSSETVRLSDLRGKVVFLDFWATWCGPCQDPMKKLNEAAKEFGPEWGDRVVLLGASVDDDAETVMDHVKENGWGEVRHLWCGEKAFSSEASTTYGISGVPTAFLIDRAGKIVWRGHPAGYDYKAEIEKLLD